MNHDLGARLLLALLSAAGAACVSLEDGAAPPEAAGASGARTSPSVATEDRALAVPAAAARTGTEAFDAEPAPREEPSRRGAPELELWSDPHFQKRFAESYLAETDVEPRLTAAEREQLQVIFDALAAEKLEKAQALLAKHGGPAASAVFDFTVANLHFQQERLDQASEAYKVAVDKYPKFRRAWRNLGLIHVRQGSFEEAAQALTRVLELGGGDAVSYGLLGFAYSNLGNHLAAESAYRMASLLDPRTLDWRMGLARSLFKQERHADAVALCRSLLADDPERADLWLLQANAYLGLNQPARAAENYELVDAMGQSTVDSLNMLGDIYVNEELFDLAVDSYARAMEKDPEAKPERALRAARVLAARGAFRETRELAARIERMHGERLAQGERKELLKLRARLAVAEGAGEEEARVLEEIVELDPLDGEALILLGQHAGRAGNPEQAIFYFERAASIAPFEADAKVRHAQLFVGQGRYVEALPLLRRAQTLQPREHVQQYLEQVERVAQGR